MKKYIVIIILLCLYGVKYSNAQIQGIKPDFSNAKNQKFYGTWVASKNNKEYTLVLKETEIKVGSIKSKAIEGSLEITTDRIQTLKLPRNTKDQFLIGGVSKNAHELDCYIEDKMLNIYSKIIITLINSNSFKWRFDRIPEVSFSKKLLSAPTDLIFYRK